VLHPKSCDDPCVLVRLNSEMCRINKVKNKF
jgi:hypothetical protein